MAQSDNHDYNVPTQGEQDWHEPLNENFEDFDTDIEIRDVDDEKGNYEPKQGAKFLATDTGRVYEGDGSNWVATLAQTRYQEPETDDIAGNYIAGHPSNGVASGVDGATIAGGGFDDGSNSRPNRVTRDGGTVSGGNDNTASAILSTVCGGSGNEASGDRSIVAGGVVNTASGILATVGGGRDNVASGDNTTVAGGDYNVASGTAAAVPGGHENTADGDYSFAFGKQADANGHDGAVVFADSSDSDFQAQNADEFRSQMPMYAPSFNTTSARAAKTNVEPVDPIAALEGVESLDVCSWEFTDTDDGRHVGPMAEDFHAAFDVASDEGSIPTVDADGVTFAAIQGLSERLDEREERIDAQRDRIDELEAENEGLRERLSALEAQVRGPETAERTTARSD